MSGTLCRHSSPLCLFGGGRWNARGMLLKSIEAHSSSSFLITPLYVGLIAQTFAPSLPLPSTRFGWIFREAGDKKKKGEKVEGIGKKDEREGWLVYFPGQTHIPGLARVPALPRVPGLTRGTFPDAPSPFTPYLRDSEPYRRNKHHVGNNVTANSVSGACTNPNNTDPTASPASSAHLGASSGSSAHQDCYKHSPQHGGESTDPFVGPSRFDSNFENFRKSIRFDPQDRGDFSGHRFAHEPSYPRGSWSGCETARKPHPPPSPPSRGGEARDLDGEGGGIRRFAR